MKQFLPGIFSLVLLLTLTLDGESRPIAFWGDKWITGTGQEAGLLLPNLEFTSSDLPIIIINTPHGMIEDINPDTKLFADMKIIYNGEGQRNNVTDENYYYQGNINIKIRGHSSQAFDKKQYAVDTRNADNSDDDDVSLFGMPEEHKWILSAVYSDKTLMRNALAYQLSRELGQYAVRTRFCEVIIDGDYRGIYIFQEKIKRGSGRVDIKKLKDDITGGYIFSVDKLDGGEITWRSPVTVPSYNGVRIPFQFVYPDEDDLDPSVPADKEKIDYLKDYVTDFEQTLIGNNFDDPVNGFRKYADPHSFVVHFLINEMSRNIDGFRLSHYMHKDKGGLIVSGPVWDFDIAWGNANYYDGNKTTGFVYTYDLPDYEANPVPFWWARLRQDDIWEEDLRYTYHSLRKTTLSNGHVFHLIDSMANEISEAQVRNFTKWDILNTTVWPNPQNNHTFQGEIDYMKNWIADRLAYLDENIPESARALPLKFVAVNVQAGSGFNQVNWVVAGDPAADYFEIERAGADYQFNQIGKVFYKNGSVSYSYQDNTPNEGTVFYRIKEVDKTGTFTYSETVSVKNESTDVWRIVPNKVKNTLIAMYQGSLATSVRTAVYTTTGRKVLENTQGAGSRLTMDVSRLSAGIYILEITDNAGAKTHLRFIKE